MQGQTKDAGKLHHNIRRISKSTKLQYSLRHVSLSDCENWHSIGRIGMKFNVLLSMENLWRK